MNRWVIIAMCAGGGVAGIAILAIVLTSLFGGSEETPDEVGAPAETTATETAVSETSAGPAVVSTPQPPAALAAASDDEIPAWAGQSSDEPFDVRQFLTSRAAPPDNAASLYMSGLAQISGELGHVSPEAERAQRVAQARSLAAAIGKLADVDKLAAGDIPAAQVDQVLNDAALVVQQIDLAQSKPKCVFVTGYSIDTLLPHVQAARGLTRISILQLYQSRVKGDFSIAEDAIRRALRLSRDLRPRGPVVSQLVSIALDGMLLAGIDRLTLNDQQLTAEQCDRILALLLEHQQRGLDRHDEGLKLEYIMLRNLIDQLRTGRLTPERLMELTGSSSGNRDNQLSFEGLDYEAEITACNRVFALALQEAKAPYAQVGRSSQVKKEIEALSSQAKTAAAAARQTGKMGAPVLVLLFAPACQTVREATTRVATNLAAVQMLVALRRYELTHGHLPESLDVAAAETSLGKVPLDSFSGQPLRYALVSGKPTVYSTGKDLKDDGGQADWQYGRQPGDYLFTLTPRPGTRLTPP